LFGFNNINCVVSFP